MKHTTLKNDTSGSIENAPLFENESTNVIDFSSTLEKLRHEVAPDMVRQRAGHRDVNGNSHMVEYVEWHTVADILDLNAPGWSHTIKDIRPIGEIITVTVAITIDNVTREGIGTGRAFSETGIKKAEHDALKRAAVKFGIARDLYKKEQSLNIRDQVNNDKSNAVPGVIPDHSTSPLAATYGDLVTPKQLGMIKARSRDADVDANEECNKLFSCKVSELSKSYASKLIDHLQALNAANSGQILLAG